MMKSKIKTETTTTTTAIMSQLLFILPLSITIITCPLVSAATSSRAPVIVEHPRSGVYARGDAIKLHCRAADAASVTIAWLKDGKYLIFI